MNPGVEMLMKLGRLGSRWARPTEKQRAEMRGVSGTMNLEFTGDDGGGWHVRFGDGRVTLHAGLAPDARATVRMKAEDYLAMVAGDLSYSVARMTGKVRGSGDGHFAMVFGAFFENLRVARSLPGLRGWITRKVVGRALKKGGYRPKNRAS